jgi:hypothetical protein
MMAVARLTWLLAAIALVCADSSQAQSTKRADCETVGPWQVCRSAMMIHSEAKSGWAAHVERDGQKIGGSAFITISQQKNLQLQADLRILFFHHDRKDRFRIEADGVVLDTIEQEGRALSYDLKPRFGDTLQALRSGDDAAKGPPVVNLKVVMLIDGEELTIFDRALTDTDQALQRHIALATAGPTPPAKQAAKSAQGRSGNERETTSKPGEAQPAAPRPPAIAVPASLDECKAIPDALEKRFRGTGQQIDHLYFFGRGMLLNACASGRFDQAQQFAIELLRRHRTTRRPQVQLYRGLAETIPMPRGRENCESLWKRVKAYVPVDDIDGEEAVSDPIFRACAAGDMDTAHKRMVNHVNIEVKTALDRFSQPGGPYGELPKSR